MFSQNQAKAEGTLTKAKTDQALCSSFQVSCSLATVSLLPQSMILLFLFLSLSNQESALKNNLNSADESSVEPYPGLFPASVWICRFIVLPFIFLDSNCLPKTFLNLQYFSKAADESVLILSVLFF